MTDSCAPALPSTSRPFDARVDRQFVHRRAISEVFLTGLERRSSAEFRVFAQWPRWHVFYGNEDGTVDSAMVVETLRQLTVLIAHSELAVPLGHQFLMPTMSAAVSPGARLHTSVPTDVTVIVRVSSVKAGIEGAAAFDTTAAFFVAGCAVATGKASARIVDPMVYRRFRKGRSPGDTHVRPGPPVNAERVGHSSPRNVVLGPSRASRRWPLRVDVSNPVLFDHPLDHVPGVLLIEAVRQALRWETQVPSLDLAQFRSTFISVAELDQKTEVVVESLSNSPGLSQAVVGIQSGGTTVMRTVGRFTPRREERIPGHSSVGEREQPDGLRLQSSLHA